MWDDDESMKAIKKKKEERGGERDSKYPETENVMAIS
jgi:hypothetical protein